MGRGRSVTLQQLLNEIAIKDIRLYTEGEALKFRAPAGAMDSVLLEQVRKNKQDLLIIVQQRPKSVVATFPLSYNQQSLWFIQQMAPGSSAYNIGLAARIVSEINIGCMQRSLELLVQRHPMLRTTYGLLPVTGMVPCQHVHDNLPPLFTVIDCSGEDESAVRRRVQEVYSMPFDPAKGPLIRGTLFSIGNADHVLLLTLHHISCDGWSFRALLTDFAAFYKQETAGIPANLPAIKTEYVQFVNLQHSRFSENTGTDSFRNWMKGLAGANKNIGLKTDKPRQEVERFEGDTVRCKFTSLEYEKIKRQARVIGVTPVSLLLSSFQYILMRQSGSNQAITGISTAGSNRQEWDNVIGNFVNPIPICSTCNENEPFQEFCKRVYSSLTQGLHHQDYPFTLLVQKIAPQREPGRHPLFQVLFNLLSYQMLGPALGFMYDYDDSVDEEWAGLRIKPFGLNQQTGNFYLSLEIADTGSSYHGVLKFRTDIFNRQTVEKIADDFYSFVRTISGGVTVTLDSISGKSITQQEQKQCLIAATFTADPVIPALEFWCKEWEWPLGITCTEYNQVFRQLLDPSSAFRTNRDGYNVCLIRFDDWLRVEQADKEEADVASRTREFTKTVGQFIEAIESYKSNTDTPCIVLLCKPSPENLHNPNTCRVIITLKNEIENRLQAARKVWFVSWEQLDALYPVEGYYEALGENLGNIPFTSRYFTALATGIARIISRSQRLPYKAVVSDCDNTLWNGVLGEDGIEGITIDPARKALQQFLVDLVSKGMLLCLCSKNDEQEVLDVLKKHPEMIIRQEHITIYKINWASKSQNISEIAVSLNIGLDSIVFIDDSPIECGEVETNLPDVCTIQVPQDSIAAVKMLRHVWAFDLMQDTQEDGNRTQLYRQESQREELKKKTFSFADFIAQLDLRVQISQARPDQIPRVSQLTIRTNQFNATTIRLNESQVKDIVSDSTKICFTVQAADRFGDYGLVGVMIVHLSDKALIVHSFMLSCRAMGRGVEHQMLSYLGRYALSKGLPVVELRYVATLKNEPIRKFLLQTCGLYKVETENGMLFQVPGDFTASLVFNPAEMKHVEIIAETKNSKPELRTGEHGRKKSVPLMLRIMKDLNEVEKIEAAFLPSRNKNSFSGSSATVTAAMSITPTQEAILSIWKDVLTAESIGVHDNFFDAGGVSIQMPAVAIQIKKALGFDVSLVDLFQYTTVDQLANFIDAKNAPKGTDEKKISAVAQKQRVSMDSLRKRQMSARMKQQEPKD